MMNKIMQAAAFIRGNGRALLCLSFFLLLSFSHHVSWAAIDTTPPMGSVVINSGATYANSNTVPLALSATDGDDLSMFENGNDGWSFAAEAYAQTDYGRTCAAHTGSYGYEIGGGDNGDELYYANGYIYKTASLPSSGTRNITFWVRAGYSGGAVKVMVGGTTVLNWTSVGTSWTQKTVSLSQTGSQQIRIYSNYADSDSLYIDDITISADASGMSQMQFSNDNTTWSSAEAYATTGSWTLTTGDGIKTVYARFKDNAGNWSSASSNTIFLDTTPPVGTISTNSGANYTNSTTASLTLSAYDDHYDLSTFESGNDGWSFAAEDYIPAEYGRSASIAHSGSYGYEIGGGDAHTGEDYTDGYIYKTVTLPSFGTHNMTFWVRACCTGGGVKVTVGGTTVLNWTDVGTSWTQKTVSISQAGVQQIRIYSSYGDSDPLLIDDISIPADANGVSQMQFSNDNVTWSALGTYATTTTWTLATGDGSKTVYARFKDIAGNPSTVSITDGITLDTTPPTGTVTINGGANYTNGTVVTLTLSANDANGVSQMQFSNDNVTWSALGTYATTTTWPLLVSDGTKTVYAKFKDNAGNWSTAIPNTIMLDTVPPVTTATPPGGTYAPELTVALASNETATIYYTTNGSTPTTGSAVYTGPIPVSGAETIKYFARDLAGNSESPFKSDTYTTDIVPPVLNLSTLPDGSFTKNPTLNIAGTVSDANGVQSLVISAPTMTIPQTVPLSTSDNINYTFSYPVSLVISSNTITIVATDLAGNPTTVMRTIILDQTAPAITIITPSDNSFTNALTTTVTGTVDETVQSVLVSIGTTTIDASVVGNVFSAPTVTLAYGVNTINIYATDLAGNPANAKRTVTYDDVNPALAITSPDQDMSTNNAGITLSGTINDITDVTMLITCPTASVGLVTNPTATSWQVDITNMTVGTNVISVTATDQVAYTTTVIRNIIYDATPPAVTINPVTTPTNQPSQTINGTMETGASVIVSCQTATVGLVSYPTATTWQAVITNMTEGNNAFSVTATDQAGNTSISANATIVLDITVPTVTITSPLAGPTTNNTPALIYSASSGTVVVQVDGFVVNKTSGNTLGPLADGQHTVLVQSTDAEGSTGTASVVFTVYTSHATSVSGHISTDTTWTLAGSPYIVTDNISVYGASTLATLTIQPGVVVKFNNGKGLTISNNTSSPGALYAVGTAASPIVFTSNDPNPAPGKWSGIKLWGGATPVNTVFDYVTVEYGGANGDLNMYGGTATIRNSTIWKSSAYGINVGIFSPAAVTTIQNNVISNNASHGIAVNTSGAVNITGNTITNNGGYGINSSSGLISATGNIITNNIGYGIYDNTASATVISGNTFTGNGSYPVHIGINQTGNANTYGTNGINAIETVGGTVAQNLTMKNSGIPYVMTSSVIVYSSSGPTLTIEPGVVVKFNNNTGLSVSSSAGNPGALQAVGTASAPIVFTSNDPNPAPGKWTGIIFNASTINSVLDYATVEYGINDIYFANVSSTVTIQDSIIRKGSNYGIRASSSTAVIQNNSIVNNGTYGFYDESSSGTVISGNTFTGNGSYPVHIGINQTGNANTYGTNGINAIETVGGQVGQSLTMKNSGIPYLVTSTVTVYGSSTTSPTAVLTVEPGVTVKFSPQKSLQIGNGSSYPGVLISKGTPTSPILFTSATTTPAPGDWSGIYLYNAPSSASDIEYTTIEYGGSSGSFSPNYFYANLYLSASSPTVRNCLIRNSAGSGIYVANVTNSLMLMDNEITGNKWGISSANSSNPSIRNSKIYANSTGIYNASSSPIPDVDARDNWWGVATGPTYTTGNPGGRGDAINDHVLYNPWLGQAPVATVSITNAKVMPLSMNPYGGFAAFTAAISSSANWTITITDVNNNAVRTFTGTGTSINQTWHGENDQSGTVGDGTYNYRIDAVDPVSGSSAAPLQGFIAVSAQYPVSIMTVPADNQMFPLGAVLNITGTATDPTNFKNYVLEYGAGENPLSWTNLKTSTTPVTNGLLYAWNTTALTGNLYTLRFTVNDNASNAVIQTARVRFNGIQNVTVTEGYISPNNDGVKDAAILGATLNQQSNWTLTVKNASGTAVRTFTGTGTSMSQSWDGKDTTGTVVSDGSYTYQLDATSTETGIAAIPKTGTIIVDTTLPAASITAPDLNSVLTGIVQIIGSASDANFNNYRVEYGPVSGAGPWSLISSVTTSVNSGTLATWVTSDQSGTVLVPNGNYIIRLSVTDQAGNSSTTTVPIGISNLTLSNILISTNSIKSMPTETSNIFFTLNSPATATFKVISENQGPTGTPIYQTAQTCTAAGPYVFAWNGTDNTGKVVPDEAYLFVIEASDGVKSVSYSPSQPTGTGSVPTCSQSTNFDPSKNLPMTITYTPSLPSRVNISISWGSENFKIQDSVAATAESHTYVWDGRDPSNMLLDFGAQSSCTVSSLLRENTIITSGDTISATDIKTDPYTMHLSYGNFTRIQYTLPRDANVTVKLTSPSGTIITLISSQLQTAGQQEIDWNGLDSTDATGKKALVTQEGDYIVSVQAVNPITGTSSTTRGNLRIRY